MQTTTTRQPGRTLPSFRLQSGAFTDGDRMPRRHTADGSNVSPPLAWSEPPPGTQAFALICEDPDAPSGTFVHWLAWNIAADRRDLPEGVLPRAPELVQGSNGFGKEGYGGPSPPPGKPHRYVFRLYALDQRIALRHGAKRDELDRAIEAHVLAEGTLVGKYGR